MVWGRKTSKYTFSARELWHAWSADGGKTWTTSVPARFPERQPFDDREATVGPGGTLHVLAHLGGLKGNDASTADLLYTQWEEGEGLDEFRALTLASKHVHGAAMAVWQGRLHLVWSQMPLPFNYASPMTILHRSRPLSAASE